MKKVIIAALAIAGAFAFGETRTVRFSNDEAQAAGGAWKIARVEVVATNDSASVTVKSVRTGDPIYEAATIKQIAPTSWVEQVVASIETNSIACTTNSIPAITNVSYVATNTITPVSAVYTNTVTTTDATGGVTTVTTVYTNHYNIVKDWYAPKYEIIPATNIVTPASTTYKTNWVDQYSARLVTNDVSVMKIAGYKTVTNTVSSVTCANGYGTSSPENAWTSGEKLILTGDTAGSRVLLYLVK